MLIFYIIKYIIININKILYKLFYVLFAPTTKKLKNISIHIRILYLSFKKYI